MLHGVVRDVIDDPSLLFTPSAPEGPVKTNRWTEPDQDDELAELYTERGILAAVPDDEEPMRHANGEMLEAGDFGVVNRKEAPIQRSTGEELAALRAVFILVPQNHGLLPFDGTTIPMPISSQRANMTLLSRELALQPLEDRERFDYLVFLPVWWLAIQDTAHRQAGSWHFAV